MGLDTSHECWHGPYSSFNSWRFEICVAAGLGKLSDYEGFGGDLIFDSNDPLTTLLYHSDCDGDIKWEECNDIADRLEECLVFIRKSTEYLDDYYVVKTVKFINGLRDAYSLKEDVDFH